MVRALRPPSRPLPKTGDKTVWWWNPPEASARWWRCRVYHQCKYTPDGVTFRQYGRAARFDHHHPADPPVVDTTGRRILYVGEDLATSACEVFGDAGIADVEVVQDDAGHLQDMALADPRILLRLEVERRRRQITVTTVPSSDCNECRKERLAP
jgi:hypothetical protein